MKVAQEQYLRKCYAKYEKARTQCQRCNHDFPDKEKQWLDAMTSVATYVNLIAAPKGFENVKVSTDGQEMFNNCIKGMGVFEADSYDTGVPAWYWRVLKTDKAKFMYTPVDALIGFVTDLETHVGADPAADGLVFIVQMPKFSCRGDDHNWNLQYHWRDDDLTGYKCLICGITKNA